MSGWMREAGRGEQGSALNSEKNQRPLEAFLLAPIRANVRDESAWPLTRTYIPHSPPVEQARYFRDGQKTRAYDNVGLAPECVELIQLRSSSTGSRPRWLDEAPNQRAILKPPQHSERDAPRSRLSRTHAQGLYKQSCRHRPRERGGLMGWNWELRNLSALLSSLMSFAKGYTLSGVREQ